MKVQVNDATPRQLNWLVAKCEGVSWSTWLLDGYATDWAQGGPIIEREEISLHTTPKFAAQCMKWDASQRNINGACVRSQFGPTPLIAAMRCYVASKLGEECDIPNELITGE